MYLQYFACEILCPPGHVSGKLIPCEIGWLWPRKPAVGCTVFYSAQTHPFLQSNVCEAIKLKAIQVFIGRRQEIRKAT